GSRHGSAPEPMSREHVWRLLDSVLKRLARHETLVLFLDDLHWADEGTVALLAHVTRNLGHARVLVIAAHRTEEVATGRPLDELARLLAPLPNFVRLPLGRLAPEATRVLVGSWSEGGAALRGRAAAIHERAQGNPLFTLELARDLASRGEPQPD